MEPASIMEEVAVTDLEVVVRITPSEAHLKDRYMMTHWHYIKLWAKLLMKLNKQAWMTNLGSLVIYLYWKVSFAIIIFIISVLN